MKINFVRKVALLVLPTLVIFTVVSCSQDEITTPSTTSMSPTTSLELTTPEPDLLAPPTALETISAAETSPDLLSLTPIEKHRYFNKKCGQLSIVKEIEKISAIENTELDNPIYDGTNYVKFSCVYPVPGQDLNYFHLTIDFGRSAKFNCPSLSSSPVYSQDPEGPGVYLSGDYTQEYIFCENGIMYSLGNGINAPGPGQVILTTSDQLRDILMNFVADGGEQEMKDINEEMIQARPF